MGDSFLHTYIIPFVYGKLTKAQILLAFIFGCITTIALYVIVYTFHQPTTIGQLHSHEILLVFVDILPLVSIIVYNNVEHYKQVTRAIQVQKELMDEQIHEYAEFAKELGNGNYDMPIGMIDYTSPIGKALVVLQDNLRNTRNKEEEIKWYINGKEIIAGVLRKSIEIETVCYETLYELIKYTKTTQGAIYLFNETDKKLHSVATYSYGRRKYITQTYSVGKGLIGEAAYEKQVIYRKEIPERYSILSSGILGDAKPKSLIIIPLVADNTLQGVMEITSINPEIQHQSRMLIEDTGSKLAQTIFNLLANYKTKSLLEASQKLTQELQQKQAEVLESSAKISSVNELLEKSHKTLEMQVEEIKNSEQRIQSILEHASEVISIYDANKKLKYESLSVKNILSYIPTIESTPEGLSHIHAQAKKEITALLDTLIRIPYKSQTIEYKFIRQDNSVVWCETTGRNFLDNKAIQGMILTTRDITIHKLAEQEQRMKGQMQALSENSPDLIVRIGVNGKIFYANPKFEVYTGLKVKTAIDKKYTDLPLNEMFLNIFTQSVEHVVENQDRIEEEFTVEIAKEQFFLMTTAIPERNEDNEIESVLIVAHDVTERKKIELEIKENNKKIQDSINYALRIQRALLPTQEQIKSILPKSFMFYRPKDVVSGDFPWMFKHDNCLYIAAVDCTGHGVPGALLSVIGYLILDSIVNHKEELSPSVILDRLHYSVRRSLKQDIEGSEARDGMDVALCKIGLDTMRLEFAGAHRPLLHLRKQEITEYKADRKAIGGVTHKKTDVDFTNHVVHIEPGDRIFFFSDGLPDQEGGEEGKKYGSRRVREVLVENYDLTIGEISRFFEQEFYEWKGNTPQLDDVLLIGIEF